MLVSIGIILVLGFLAGEICKKIKLPSLIGMIAIGMLIGPFGMNLLSADMLTVAPDFRQLALVVILLRAGLALRLDDLKAVGRPAFLLCFVPACFEIVGVMIIAPPLLSISLLEAGILGTVLAAVSPAVIVPRMLRLMDEGYGTKHHIPQMIMAGASVDDVFVIVLFTALTAVATGGSVTASTFIQVPVSILLGIILGIIAGFILNKIFNKTNLNIAHKVMIVLATSILFIGLEDILAPYIALSALLGIMSMGAMIYRQNNTLAQSLSQKFGSLWMVAEILLFVLVGTAVDISYALNAGLLVLGVIVFALVFRVFGVVVSTAKTPLTTKERGFSVLAYLPKATVQAAIGAVPLAMGLPCGNIVLTGAVVAILFTAPLGAIAIDLTYKKLLDKE